MKTYIVYDAMGNEVAIIKAKSHNDAEKKSNSKIWGKSKCSLYWNMKNLDDLLVGVAVSIYSFSMMILFFELGKYVERNGL